MTGAFSRIASCGSVVGLALALGFGASGCDKDENPSDPATSRTIDFPGDAPTLQEAVDMAIVGDTVRVGAGTHAVDTTLIFGAGQAGVTLVGRTDEAEKAPAERPVIELASDAPVDGILVRADVPGVTIRGLAVRGSLKAGVGLLGPGGTLVDCSVVGARNSGVVCTQPSSDGKIESNLIVDASPFGVYCVFGAHPQIIGNTIVRAGDCGILTTGSSPSCSRNIIFGSVNWGIACFDAPFPSLSCNALFGSGNADYSPQCPQPGAGDFHADPLFCDSTSFALRANSPCAPANAGACGRIGAVGVCE